MRFGRAKQIQVATYKLQPLCRRGPVRRRHMFLMPVRFAAGILFDYLTSIVRFKTAPSPNFSGKAEV
jgi:hypothetical protein